MQRRTEPPKGTSRGGWARLEKACRVKSPRLRVEIGTAMDEQGDRHHIGPGR